MGTKVENYCDFCGKGYSTFDVQVAIPSTNNGGISVFQGVSVGTNSFSGINCSGHHTPRATVECWRQQVNEPGIWYANFFIFSDNFEFMIVCKFMFFGRNMQIFGSVQHNFQIR